MKTWLTLQHEAEAPFTHFGDAIPDKDVDLAAAMARAVVAPAGPREDAAPDDFAAKARNMARALHGQSELVLINALCIALLRRRNPPPHIAGVFHRIWRDHHADLAPLLSARWVISTAQTLADFGETEVQRRAGGELTVLVSVMKLADSEKQFTGRPVEELHPRRRKAGPLALDLDAFAFAGGDLDRAMFTRLWRLAARDPVAEALIHPVLSALLNDPRALFNRVLRMRARKRQK